MSWLVALVVAGAPAAIEPVLHRHGLVLASDAFEGRAPGTAGDKATQQYVAAQFAALGLEPAGDDGGFFQSVSLVSVENQPVSIQADLKDRGRMTLSAGRDVVVVSGQQGQRVRVQNAELVFVGYGITAPDQQWDDFKGLDVRGKVLLVLNDDPSDDPSRFGGPARQHSGRWDFKFEQARQRGAAGCLIVHTSLSAGYSWQVVQNSWSGPQLALPRDGGLAIEGWLTESATQALLTRKGLRFEALRAAAQRADFVPLRTGITVSAQWQTTVKTIQTANVAGRFRGLEPSQVVLTAHHDHLGRTKGAGDTIFNGAIDNAGGVAMLLVVAQLLALGPRLQRSVLIVATAAEEQGLLGSHTLLARAPRGSMVANINIDGINVWGPTRDVSVVGFGRSTLDGVVEAVAKTQGRVLRPEAVVERGAYFRSDQFAFAQAGVPAIALGSGSDFIGRPAGWGAQRRAEYEINRYHQVSDEWNQAWPLAGAVDDSLLVLGVVQALASSEQTPRWVPGDEFSKRRTPRPGSPASQQ